jgi:hypothetical protein
MLFIDINVDFFCFWVYNIPWIDIHFYKTYNYNDLQ